MRSCMHSRRAWAEPQRSSRRDSARPQQFAAELHTVLWRLAACRRRAARYATLGDLHPWMWHARWRRRDRCSALLESCFSLTFAGTNHGVNLQHSLRLALLTDALFTLRRLSALASDRGSIGRPPAIPFRHSPRHTCVLGEVPLAPKATQRRLLRSSLTPQVSQSLPSRTNRLTRRALEPGGTAYGLCAWTGSPVNPVPPDPQPSIPLVCAPPLYYHGPGAPLTRGHTRV